MHKHQSFPRNYEPDRNKKGTKYLSIDQPSRQTGKSSYSHHRQKVIEIDDIVGGQEYDDEYLEQIGDVCQLVDFYMMEKINNNMISAWLAIKYYFTHKIDIQLSNAPTQHKIYQKKSSIPYFLTAEEPSQSNHNESQTNEYCKKLSNSTFFDKESADRQLKLKQSLRERVNSRKNKNKSQIQGNKGYNGDNQQEQMRRNKNIVKINRGMRMKTAGNEVEQNLFSNQSETGEKNRIPDRSMKSSKEENLRMRGEQNNQTHSYRNMKKKQAIQYSEYDDTFEDVILDKLDKMEGQMQKIRSIQKSRSVYEAKSINKSASINIMPLNNRVGTRNMHSPIHQIHEKEDDGQDQRVRKQMFTAQNSRYQKKGFDSHDLSYQAASGKRNTKPSSHNRTLDSKYGTPAGKNINVMNNVEEDEDLFESFGNSERPSHHYDQLKKRDRNITFNKRESEGSNDQLKRYSSNKFLKQLQMSIKDIEEHINKKDKELNRDRRGYQAEETPRMGDDDSDEEEEELSIELDHEQQSREQDVCTEGQDEQGQYEEEDDQQEEDQQDDNEQEQRMKIEKVRQYLSKYADQGLLPISSQPQKQIKNDYMATNRKQKIGQQYLANNSRIDYSTKKNSRNNSNIYPVDIQNVQTIQVSIPTLHDLQEIQAGNKSHLKYEFHPKPYQLLKKKKKNKSTTSTKDKYVHEHNKKERHRYTDRDDVSGVSIGIEDPKYYSNTSYHADHNQNKKNMKQYGQPSPINSSLHNSHICSSQNFNHQMFPVFVPGIGYVMPIGMPNPSMYNYNMSMNMMNGMDQNYSEASSRVSSHRVQQNMHWRQNPKQFMKNLKKKEKNHDFY